MLKIAICDDEQPIRDYLKKLTEKCTDAQVHVFANGEELLSDPTVYDIILLDISLNRKPDSGKPNGMEVAKKIRETSDVIIIFVTALKEYVFEGYDVGAFHGSHGQGDQSDQKGKEYAAAHYPNGWQLH